MLERALFSKFSALLHSVWNSGDVACAVARRHQEGWNNQRFGCRCGSRWSRLLERKGPGWTGWLDSRGDGDRPICGTGSNSRHGSYVRSLQDLPAQGTSVLIQATRRVAGPPRAPRFTYHKLAVWPIGTPRRASARVPHRVKQSPSNDRVTPGLSRVVRRPGNGIRCRHLDGRPCRGRPTPNGRRRRRAAAAEGASDRQREVLKSDGPFRGEQPDVPIACW
jgi:hypothetical protein